MSRLRVIAVALLIGVVAAQPHRTVTIEAKVHTEPWRGWGGGEPATQPAVGEQLPEKLTRFATPAGQVQTFTGKVVGIPPGKTAQVGVVALRGTHWIRPANYKWTDCAPDGSFSATGDHAPNARKALVAAVDGRPWTFLRAGFAAGESARGIELRVREGKTIVLTMEDARGRAVQNFKVEVFNAYKTFDDAGAELDGQRIAAPSTAKGAITLAAPLEPIAVLAAAAAGSRIAPYYAIIDPREADGFHFRMLADGRIRGTVSRDGQPVAGERMMIVNYAAPLSATVRTTDALGHFDLADRVPGTHEITVGTYRTTVQVQPGETAEVTIELGGSSPAGTEAR